MIPLMSKLENKLLTQRKYIYSCPHNVEKIYLEIPDK